MPAGADRKACVTMMIDVSNGSCALDITYTATSTMYMQVVCRAYVHKSHRAFADPATALGVSDIPEQLFVGLSHVTNGEQRTQPGASERQNVSR